jgi:DNA-binding transcriptional LysR family regulator
MARRFDHLGDVEVFIAVVEAGSLTAGAVALSTTPSVVSRALARLEARLGSQLLRRTTRSIGLTDAGRLYLEQTRNAFSLIDNAEREIQGEAGVMRGRVRLSVSTTYGHYRLPAMLRRFSQRYPQVQIDLHISNRNVDLVADGFDMAIRFGDLPDSGMVARKLEDATLCLVAAPEYLAHAGSPADIAALRQHPCVSFVTPSTGRVLPWLLREDGRDVDWMPDPHITISDDVLGVVSLAEQGLGICQTYDFIVRERLARGTLAQVLPQSRGRTRPFSVIYAPHRSLSAAARALIEVLTQTPVE